MSFFFFSLSLSLSLFILCLFWFFSLEAFCAEGFLYFSSVCVCACVSFLYFLSFFYFFFCISYFHIPLFVSHLYLGVHSFLSYFFLSFIMCFVFVFLRIDYFFRHFLGGGFLYSLCFSSSFYFFFLLLFYAGMVWIFSLFLFLLRFSSLSSFLCFFPRVGSRFALLFTSPTFFIHFLVSPHFFSGSFQIFSLFPFVFSILKFSLFLCFPSVSYFSFRWKEGFFSCSLPLVFSSLTFYILLSSFSFSSQMRREEQRE